MKKLLLTSIAAAALGVLAATSAQAAVTTYTSAAAWDIAVSNNYVVEPFASTGLQSFTGVVTSVGAIGPASGLLSGSAWLDRPTLGGGESTTFSYLPGALMGIGAIWDTSPGGEGQGLLLTINLVGGGTESAGAIGPLDNGFFGFVSTDLFTSYTITAGYNGGAAETFNMQALDFAPASVPEPASMAILGAGLIGLRLSRRRRA